MATATVPRGIRNNNPGNIRKSSEPWRGLLPDAVQTDPAFFRFSAPEWGIRAIAVILRTYQTKHGLKSVRALIHRWAPTVENDTEAYVAAVAKAVGVGPDEPIDLRDADDMRGMVLAIIRHENGQQPYDMAVINRGLERAGIVA
jgi:hypothetical protein